MKVTGGLRYRLCALCGDMHEVANWPDNHVQPIAAPMVIRDEMPAIQGQHDGKMYDSKRALRASYQPSGNAEGKYFTEIGNEVQKRTRVKPDRRQIKDSVQKAAAKLRNGEVTPMTYATKVITRPGPI